MVSALPGLLKGRQKLKLEDYRRGYPRLAAFLSIDPAFTLVRRFDNLHLRILLEQQAQISELELQLNEIDDTEEVQLNLSSCKKDTNLTRRNLIEEVRVKLEEYDKSVLRYNQLSKISRAECQHQQSVKNWMDGNKPVVRSEADWVSHLLYSDDFMALQCNDSDKAGLEAVIETILKKWPALFGKLSSSKEKTDDNQIMIFSSAMLRKIVRIAMSVVVPLWTILPGILIFTTSHKGSKAALYSVFMMSTSLAVCFTTSTTNYTMVIAIVSYGAVLATFLS
ncbi:hypothetical protein EJ04DRAFT_542850 [Polyplosphaeria fusca]|uniref:DUF6594 domain-containing protein n=1 Tax=Polyplosphaeria fusca TaxID=682080 RepID=A0A9P4V3V2_9PLEO|nr:hypothetical protein EJ04DRAFT_542850 [Polyplosphaeria fusca]